MRMMHIYRDDGRALIYRGKAARRALCGSIVTEPVDSPQDYPGPYRWCVKCQNFQQKAMGKRI